MKHDETPSAALSDTQLAAICAGGLRSNRDAPQTTDPPDPQIDDYVPTFGLAIPIPVGNAETKPGERQGRTPQGLS